MNKNSTETDDALDVTDKHANANSLDSLRQEYISQPESNDATLPAPKQNSQIYFDKGQRLKILIGLVVTAVALLSVLVFASGAWSRYSATLSNDITFEDIPVALEQELAPEPIPTDNEFELPGTTTDYDLPLPGEYSLPEVTPWPTPELTTP